MKSNNSIGTTATVNRSTTSNSAQNRVQVHRKSSTNCQTRNNSNHLQGVIGQATVSSTAHATSKSNGSLKRVRTSNKRNANSQPRAKIQAS